VSERGWVTVENAIEICRSPEDVFDYLTDVTMEVEWNPRTRRAGKLSPGPIGLGTGSVRSGSRATRQSPGTSGSSGRWLGRPALVPGAWMRRARGGSRRRNRAPGSWSEPKFRPKGLLALLLPLMRRTMREREDQNLYRVKAILESTR
jgi:hypothetical protein